MRTLKHVAVKRGGSVTIPCLYDEKYKANSKFWCKGNYWSTCSIVAYANSRGNPSVIDHPEQNLLTVELNSVSESGTGWCAAEIGDKWQPDDRDYLYLMVSQDPDLSVSESRVRGEEGGSVTVQCLYSAAYQNTQKQWCRFKDGQCNTVGTETSQNSAVYISDDGRRSFSVRMSRLKKSDAGWYWCSAGDLQVPVHISVSDPPPVTTSKTTTVTTTAHQDNTYTFDSKHNSVFVTSVSSRNETTSLVWTLNHWYLVALLLPLVILVIIICMLRKKCELENQTRIRERSNDTTVPTPNTDEDSIVYSTVAVSKPKAKNKPTCTAEDSIIYSTVATKSKKQATFTDEDSIIYSTVAKTKPKVSPNDVTNETLYSYEVYQ